jgi:ribonuclease HI
VPRRRIVIRTDGAARGNPGPAGAGFVLESPRGKVIREGSIYLGERTNNQAEYDALLHALEAVAPDSETHLEVYSDSELMVRQLNGEYKVKHLDLKDRHGRASWYLLRAASSTVRHVPRGENARADELANQAIEVHLKCTQGTDGQTAAGGSPPEESPGSTGQDARGGFREGANARHPSG